jgi:hypothetical protein
MDDKAIDVHLAEMIRDMVRSKSPPKAVEICSADRQTIEQNLGRSQSPDFLRYRSQSASLNSSLNDQKLNDQSGPYPPLGDGRCIRLVASVGGNGSDRVSNQKVGFLRDNSTCEMKRERIGRLCFWTVRTYSFH